MENRHTEAMLVGSCRGSVVLYFGLNKLNTDYWVQFLVPQFGRKNLAQLYFIQRMIIKTREVKKVFHMRYGKGYFSYSEKKVF